MKCVKINSVNSLYHIFSKVNGYFEQINGNKYLTIRSITKNSDDYDEKHVKIKFTSDDESPLNKTIEIPSMIIIVRAVFHENNKYYSEVFLGECLHKL